MSGGPRALIGVFFTALLLLALYVGLKPPEQGVDAQASPGTRTFELSIGPPSPGDVFPIFKALRGDRITFTIRSDRAGEINLHGYEKHVAVAPSNPSQLTLIATASGAFPLHLHELADLNAPDGEVMHRHLAVLEVQPH